MMPYIPAPLFELEGIPFIGTVPIHLFGILVMTGVLVGAWIAEKQAVRMGLSALDLRWLATRTVIGGFLISHVVDVIAYNPERILEDPWILLSFWAGLSSFGGFFGAAATYIWLTRREKLPPLPFADAIALGLAPAWVIGRLGCYTAHDHPGFHSDFFLAVAYPDGPRHDLGLYEAIVTVFLVIALYAFARKRRGPGAIVGFLAVIYAPPRFLLDFLRATDVQFPDPRYFGLTPGQWASIGCFALGVYMLRRAWGQPPYSPPPETTPEQAATDGESGEPQTA